MGAITGWKRLALGLGMALGLAATANAQTYTGTYSGGDRGNITIQITPNGAVSCNLQSAADNGNFFGSGEVIERNPYLVFACYNYSQPSVMVINGHNASGADTLMGEYIVLPPGARQAKQGAYFAKVVGGGEGGGGEIENLQTPLSPQAISGEWYDPAYDGTGFNFLVADNGFFAHYYGRTADGEMLWLVTTDVPTGPLKTHTQYNLVFGTTQSGTFARPTSDVAHWGQLEITFTSCTRATATLSGKDGVKQLNLQRLAAIGGVAGCQ